MRYLFDRMPERDVVCWNAVVASHIRCGLVDDAEEVFEAMPVRNVSSWTTMIGGFVQTGKSVEAFALFHQMQMDGVKPDKMAVVTILSAIMDLECWIWADGFMIMWKRMEFGLMLLLALL